nr:MULTISPECIES: metallophosphoesterase [unclassified Clostridium]
MFINDIHSPYEREDLLSIISKHANEITTLVIGGDLMDCESISSFPKISRMSLLNELLYTYNLLKKIRKILNRDQNIIIINGNHEERLRTMICKMHEKDLQKFINPNILEMLVDGFTIYEDNKKVKYEGIEGITYIPHWYANIDDKIIISHPKDFSAVDGKMCEKVSEHFLNKHENFEVLVFAHTHKYSQMKVSRRQGVFVVENGCLCKPHDYSDTGKLGFTPQDYCYTIIKYNNDEKINLNNIKVYQLDEIENKQEEYKVILK